MRKYYDEDGHEVVALAEQFIAELAAKGIQPHVIDSIEQLAAPLLAVQEGVKLESLEQYLPQPVRVKQTHILTAEKSFIEYLNRFKNSDSIVIAQPQEHTFGCILDYHAAESSPSGKQVTPAWCDHTCVLKLELSNEWNTWLKMNNQPFQQAALCDFIQENGPDFLHPTHADMLELVQRFDATQDVSFKSAMRMESGDVELRYETNTAVHGTVQIPQQFEINIPVFQHDNERVPLKAWFRYTIREGVLIMRYKLHRPDKVFDNAFEAVCENIKEETVLPVYIA
jgi:uncharacterized protein YfdQ (DUF2303 family)